MKKTFTKAAVAVAMTFSLSSTAFAIQSEMSDAEKAAQKVEANIQQSSPSLRGAEVIVDKSAKKFQETVTDQYVPVVFNGTRFLVDDDGSMLIRPSAAFWTGNNGIEMINNRLIAIDMASEQADAWPSHKLPEGVEKKGDLFVVTDPTCGYCQRVEEEVQRYLEEGVEVHYIPYPRAGVRDTSNAGYARWAMAACSDDPAVAYREISLGQQDKYMPPADMNAECTNIIKEGYAYGQLIGVTGTPFLYVRSVDGSDHAAAGAIPIDRLLPRVGITVKADPGAQLMQ